MRKYQKSGFIFLISDGVWGLFLIQTFLKNTDPPLCFQNSQIEIGTFLCFFLTRPSPIWTLSQIFSFFFSDASPCLTAQYENCTVLSSNNYIELFSSSVKSFRLIKEFTTFKGEWVARCLLGRVESNANLSPKWVGTGWDWSWQNY